MLYIKYTKASLTVEGGKSSLEDPVIKSFLTRMGFALVESKRYAYHGSVTGELVSRIANFFDKYDEKFEMDHACLEYYQKQISYGRDFQALGDRGLRIKNSIESGRISVPLLSEGRALMPYQIMPVKHAVALGNVANFSVPGSGKTWMAYSAYLLMKHGLEGGEVDKLLVVGPLSSFKPWETEYQEMTNHKANSIRVTGNERKRREIFNKANKYEIFLTSYATAEREHKQISSMLTRWKFMVVVDESHHIKNPDGKQSKAIRSISKFAHRRMILTGTPVPNTLKDLWSQFTFIHPNMDVLGPFERFNNDLENGVSDRALHKLLSPYFTRVSKSTLNLPIPQMTRVPVPMSRIQRRIYATIANHIRANDANYHSDTVAMRRWRRNNIVYLLETATDPSLLTKNTQFSEDLISSEGLPIQELLNKYHELEIPNKINLVKALAEKNLEQGKKIIIWCSFIATIKKLEKVLKRYKPLAVYGMIPRDDEQDKDDNRESRIEAFKTGSSNNVLIANPASLAESVSLHRACHHAIYLDRTFNGGHYLQSLERIHRIGMDPNIKTQYTIFMSEGTIDYDVDDRLEVKKKRMQRFLDDDAFKTLDMDHTYDNPIGADEELDDDYRAVLKRIQAA